ncbi:MAG: hypothetical protein HOG19_16700, partial [Gammaproteobacteria bacterium]|nr:hypothetical protein [Gammaproteobacteria bacterium]
MSLGQQLICVSPAVPLGRVTELQGSSLVVIDSAFTGYLVCGLDRFSTFKDWCGENGYTLTKISRPKVTFCFGGSSNESTESYRIERGDKNLGVVDVVGLSYLPLMAGGKFMTKFGINVDFSVCPTQISMRQKPVISELLGGLPHTSMNILLSTIVSADSAVVDDAEPCNSNVERDNETEAGDTEVKASEEPDAAAQTTKQEKFGFSFEISSDNILNVEKMQRWHHTSHPSFSKMYKVAKASHKGGWSKTDLQTLEDLANHVLMGCAECAKYGHRSNPGTAIRVPANKCYRMHLD